MVLRRGDKQDVYAAFYENSHIPGRYSAYIRGHRCSTLEGFFMEYSAAFQFPYYFGENWNALDECSTDLDWISFESIAIIVDDYEMMFSNEPQREDVLKTFEREMIELQEYWESERHIPFVFIVFNQT